MIINSLLDTDIYKYSMMQAVLHQFPSAEVEYRFKCRNEGIDLRPIRDDLQRELEHLCSLMLSHDELEYLSSLRYMKPDFIEFLRLFHLQSRFVHISEQDEQLNSRIRGPWLHTILFEVPLLAIISELYARHTWPNHNLDERRRRLDEKIELIREFEPDHHFVFSDFGTRRRLSAAWQDEVVEKLSSRLPKSLPAPSTVWLAQSTTPTPIASLPQRYHQAARPLS